MARIRKRTTGKFAGGTYSNGWGVTNTYFGGDSRYEYMSDDPSGSAPYPSKGAYRTVTRRYPSRLNGIDGGSGKNAYTYNNFPLDRYALPTSAGASWQNWATLSNKALAGLTTKPPVDLPLFLWELKDLPRLIRDTGDVLRRRRNPDSDTVLAVNFGWTPLLNDLRNLLTFVEQMEEQNERVKKLNRTKRLEIGLGTNNRTWSGPSTSFYLGTARYTWHYSYKSECRAWAVGKIKYRTSAPDVDVAGLNVFRRVMGIQSYETLWNMMPWSWLIDYLVDVSGFLVASQGFLTADLTELCLMQRCTTTATATFTREDGVSGGVTPGQVKTTSWKRNVLHNPRPRIVFDPILSGKQITNLVALATSSRPRYSR